ncbi:MAG: DNA translocase FtsK [Bacteroides sp.]|nr:DNA translocase FtsK [Bacteroides sp.]
MIGVSIILVSAVVLIFFAQLAKFFRWIGGHISAARARREKRRMERLEAKIAEERLQEIRKAAAAMKNEEPSTTNEGEKDSSGQHSPNYNEPLEELVDLDDYQTDEQTEQETYHAPHTPAQNTRTSHAAAPQSTIEIKAAPVSPLDALTEEPKPKNHPVPEAPIKPVQNTQPTVEPIRNADSRQTPATSPNVPEQTSAKPQSGEVETVTTVAAPIEVAEHDGGDLYDPTAELSHYKRPPLELLHERPVKTNSVDEQEQEENKERITRVLNNFGIEISKIVATVGPTITLYEIVPAEGVRINKIRNLEDDIALSLSAIGIRIIAPMPGKGTIGIEVPNKDAQIVSIRSILSSKKFQETKAELPMAMGATISNEVYIADLTKMPHLLVAGSTGMGKSVGLNTIIASILYKKHPAEVKFVLVDPKMVEFSLYGRLERHYLAKLPDEEKAIITDPAKVVPTLNSLCTEMDNRYELLMKANVRGIKEYNDKFVQRRLNPHNGHQYLPYIIVIIDEFADLIMTAGKEVETPIARIAQKARAVGIHIILATQRPSANIITGVIRANFPGRIAFRVTQMLESRIILDRPGANQLIGRGDMLFSRDGSIERVQCAFIDTDEVDGICEWISNQTGYQDAYLLPEYVAPNGEGGNGGGGSERMTDRDPLFEAAARMVIESGVGSTTALQRRYNIGFPRAGKIMDQLERAGIVGPSTGGKPRQVLMDSLALERYLEICGGNNVM